MSEFERFPRQKRFLACPGSLWGFSSRPGPTTTEQTSPRADWGGDLVGGLRGRPEAWEPGRAAVRRAPPRLPSARTSRPGHRGSHLLLQPGPRLPALLSSDRKPRRLLRGSGLAHSQRRGGVAVPQGRGSPPGRRASPSRAPRVESPTEAGGGRKPHPPPPGRTPDPCARGCSWTSTLRVCGKGSDPPARWPGRFGGAWGGRGGFPTGKKRLARPPRTTRSQRPASRSEALNRGLFNSAPAPCPHSKETTPRQGSDRLSRDGCLMLFLRHQMRFQRKVTFFSVPKSVLNLSIGHSTRGLD